MKTPTNPDRLLAAADRKYTLTYVGVALLLVVAIVIAGDEIRIHLAAIETWISGLGPWGIVAFVALYVAATTLLFPESVLSIAAGALFGFAWGIALSTLAALLAAALQYALARWLVRARVERALSTRPSLAAIERAVSRQELRLQVLLRLTPLNPATTSYLLGAAGVRFTGFMLACLAIVPHLLIEVYFGYAGRHVAHLAGGGRQAVYLHDAMIIGGLAVVMVVLVLVSRMAHKAVLEAVSGPGTGPTDPSA
jgi:uncharacterized membrane protein YdjX (TVP38/TMEM64 family)